MRGPGREGLVAANGLHVTRKGLSGAGLEWVDPKGVGYRGPVISIRIRAGHAPLQSSRVATHDASSLCKKPERPKGDANKPPQDPLN